MLNLYMGDLHKNICMGAKQMSKIKNIDKKEILIIIMIIAICGVIFFFETQKKGFHEDEVHSNASAVNPYNGLMVAYENNTVPDEGEPVWKTREYVQEYMTLSINNYFNLISIYKNQALDNHPPVFYILLHFSTILFGGKFTKYSAFLVNIIGFILSCYVIKKILESIKKEELTIPILITYGLCMGTISMVIYQKMYMLLTFFILLYFYYTIKIYKNDFNLDKELKIKLSISMILGFLTQYFFVFYAGAIFIIILINMIKQKKYKDMREYIKIHIISAILGILLFVPCIFHLLFSERGISNIANHNYFINLMKYVKYLAYAFTIKESMLLIYIALFIAFILITVKLKKNDERFIVLLAIIPTILFFAVTIKLTSFQELRYIMPMIPFIVFSFMIIIDTLLQKVKYKNIIIIGIAILLSVNGLIFAKPKFLYEEYEKCISIAKENSEKSFVYIYDNFFNHMKSIPEMMIYNKTLIINTRKNELEYLINDEELNNEEQYILCIRSYMNNEEILEKITSKTPFKKIKTLYTSKYGASDEYVEDNLYLVSK